MMTIRRFTSVLFLAISLSAAGAQEAASRTLEWKAVGGAYGYVVEIRNSGQETVFNETTTKPSMTFKLPPGDYEAKITVLNKFRKPASVSPWTSISVRKSVKPELRRTGGEALYAGAAAQLLSIEGANFLPETEIVLEAGGKAFKGSIVEQGAASLVASFDLARAAPGTYALKLKNPPSSVSEAGFSIAVLERSKPGISALSKTEFTNDRVHGDLVVDGSGFRPGIEAAFVSPEGLSVKAGALNVESPERLSLSWNAGDLKPGKWKFVLTNPGGLSAESPSPIVLRLPNAGDREAASDGTAVSVGPERIVEKIVEVPVDRIVERIVEVSVDRVVEKIVEVPVDRVVEKIVEVPVDRVVEKIVEVPVDRVVEKIVEVPSGNVVEKIVEVSVEKVVETEGPERIVIRDLPFTVTEGNTVLVPKGGSGGIVILAGYPFVIGFEEFAHLFDFGFMNASLAVQADIGNGVLHLLPVAKLLAVEVDAVYSEAPGRPDIITPYMRSLQAGACLVLRSRFPIPIQASLRIGGGAVFSWMEKTSPFTAAPVGESSVDFCVRAGGSVFLELKSGFTVEAVVEYVPLFYALSTFTTMQVGVRTGWRFN